MENCINAGLKVSAGRGQDVGQVIEDQLLVDPSRFEYPPAFGLGEHFDPNADLEGCESAHKVSSPEGCCTLLHKAGKRFYKDGLIYVEDPRCVMEGRVRSGMQRSG
ncbi:hypothetical protein J2T22_001870 [Pseudarthrobacter defluvii]|uniref:Uncharacterized protein n=1 Tax=Pseudarthrobacter defluvii TaxID=410837 RepID=A0ABT9UGA1_9MICC|nr:hypothetical protein [Pseudarthrobacter defluvii]MDQ0118684.1 hypothetical protein [Pseudarthrobacter defluvii]